MHRRQQPLTIVLLALALFLRVWVPAGWMPSASGGAFAIELCPGDAPAAMTHAGHHGSSHKAQHDGDCSFAPLSSGLAASPDLAVLPPPVSASADVPQHSAAPAFATGPPAPPPPATGPPTLA